ncbi:MAG: hypothetical protein QOK18_253 [Mycobacterium sp.]|jgi:hypothetical protein|nr:hypothetical protein [Mycobacterium sp.]
MTTPDPRLDRFTSFSRQLVDQAGTVALSTNDQIDNGTFDFATWAKSMLQLFDFGLAGGLALAPDMVVPCFPCPPGGDGEADLSDYIDVNPDTRVSRRLSVVPGSFRHEGTALVIPDQFLSCAPSVLKPLETQFRIAVAWPDLRSGTYRGAVRLVPEVTGASGADVVQVIVDL